MSARNAFVPAASLEGIAWPMLPTGENAAILAILDQLGQSQWWPQALLRRQQRRQLAALAAHAARTVPFWRDRLDGLAQGGALTDDAWRRVPVLTRRDVQDAGAALHSTAIPPEHGGWSAVSTSGSTGTPVTVRRTQLAHLFWQAVTLRDHLWHGRDLAARAALIRHVAPGAAPPPDGTALPDWRVPVWRSGPAALLDILAPVAAQADWLVRQRADYLLTQPANLAALARHVQDARLPLRLRAITTIGGVVDDALRRQARAAFGAGIADVYSANEVGYIALQCPAAEHYHVQAEDMLVEVLDQAGNDCAPGEIGRVVVTPLHDYAMPLLRYAIGDFAEVGGPCACGRGLPVLARICGRARNRLRLPSGAHVYPRVDGARFAAIAPIVQFQVVQALPDRLDVLLVARRPLDAAEQAALRAALAASVGWDFPLAIGYAEAIARGPGGKYEDFRSELES